MKIQYLPTGNIFDLPEKECKRIFNESPFNYKVLDDSFEIKSEPEKGTIADMVIENSEQEETEEGTTEKTEEEIKAELIKRCKELGIGGQPERCKCETLRAKIKQKEAELRV